MGALLASPTDMQTAYLYALSALTVLILFLGDGRMRRTVLTILAVMLAAWSLSGLWPTVGYAWAMIGVDSLAIIAICWHPAGKWQSAVGAIYVIQVGIHIGRIFLGDNTDMFAYWLGLSVTAIVQLMLLGGWGIHEWLVRRFGWRDHHPAPYHSRAPGVAR